MNISGRAIVVLVCGSGINACADLTHYNIERELSPDSAVFMDAKQRGVYRVSREVTDADNNTTVFEGICAEPSPDALSAFAASLGIDLTVSQQERLSVAQSIGESAGSLGIRTAAIEALRDIMYRNCEAYALGGVSEIGIETLQRRFQSTMVAILAIEQLTGAVRAPAITLAGSSSVGAADEILGLTEKTETARAALTAAEKKQAEAEEAAGEAALPVAETQTKIDEMADEIAAIKAKQEDGEELTDAETTRLAEHEVLINALTEQQKTKADADSAVETAKASTSAKREALEVVDAARRAALAGSGSSAASGQIGEIPPPQPLSDSAVSSVAKAVKDIVAQATSELRFSDELCTTLIGQNGNVTPNQGSALQYCLDRMASGDYRVAQIDLMQNVQEINVSETEANN